MAAFRVTALELVNRVHSRRREPAVGAISSVQDIATLNAINSAIEEVMESQDWEFNQRNDGAISIQGRVTDVNAVVTLPGPGLGTQSVLLSKNGDTAFPIRFGSGNVARVEFSGHADYGSTAFRVNRITPGTATSVTGFTSHIFTEAVSLSTAILSWAEYILPDTVRSVTRVRYQQEDITLENVDPNVEYDELFPRPTVQYGPPEICAVGGFDVPTYSTTATTPPSAGLRVAIWPVPDDLYHLAYSYQYRHPELTLATSKLSGVPPNIVSRIVDVAATDMKIYYENDYDALVLRRSNQAGMDRSYARHGASRAARKPIGNWDGSAARARRIRDGFGGKLIGT